ncbi:MAG: response regulator [Chloroflexi bacterium]|nr:response regulator [Chloroflexota bacterium]
MNTILVLDDDRVFCNLIEIMLQLEGYRAVVISVPEDLIPRARELKPDLILMDVHVANSDTFGVLHDLKADDLLGGVPVIMTSGIDHGEQCLSAGARAFLFKPFRPSELLSTISEVLVEPDN